MNKSAFILFLLSAISVQLSYAQPDSIKQITVVNETYTRIKGYEQQDYSGITPLGDDRYAVASDKKDGYFLFSFDIDEGGDAIKLSIDGFFGDAATSRDCEGIVYHPERKTLFITGEADQQIEEYRLDGSKTENRLDVPEVFRYARPNFGFEALGYSPETNLFWTTTEATLVGDGEQATSRNRIHNLLRLQSFDGQTLEPTHQYAYKMEMPEGSLNTYVYAHGVSAITALPDGRLLVLEREFYATKLLFITWVKNKLFVINPNGHTDVSEESDLRNLPDDYFVKKEPVWEKKTRLISFGTPRLANFEGMCLGPVLSNGNQALILVNDSQSGAYRVMKEYIGVLEIAFF